jgi:hypothetical protein
VGDARRLRAREQQAAGKAMREEAEITERRAEDGSGSGSSRAPSGTWIAARGSQNALSQGDQFADTSAA